jgi:hypothetical protein
VRSLLASGHRREFEQRFTRRGWPAIRVGVRGPDCDLASVADVEETSRMILRPPRSVDPFYIKQKPRARRSHVVLKDGETFVVLSRSAEIGPIGRVKDGLCYSGGTRFLSRLALAIGRSTARSFLRGVPYRQQRGQRELNQSDLINDGVITIHRGTVHVSHTIVLAGSARHHPLRIRNHGLTPVRVNIDVTFAADLRDIFEVRGAVRPSAAICSMPSRTPTRSCSPIAAWSMA